MRRALSLWLPTWATDLAWRRICGGNNSPGRFCRDGRRPIILLTERRGSHELIACRCALAARFGVSPGMDLSHARILIPSYAQAHIEEHRPERDQSALHQLACWALRYSSTVAVDPPDGLLLDATGLERIYAKSGEAGLSRALGEGLIRRSFGVRIAVAATFAAARAIARFGPNCVTHVPPGGDCEALASLPTAALGIDSATASACEEIGLTKIGDFLNLPRGSLASQFGAELVRRLDCALGLAPEIVESVHPESPPQASILFDGPTDRWESLAAATDEALGRLVSTLRSRGMGARGLELEALRPSGSPRDRHHVRLSRASVSQRHLHSMLRPILERVDMATGVEGVVITATDVGRLVPRQAFLETLAPPSQAPDDVEWGEVLDTLARRLGVDNVLRFEAVESHLPERAFRARPGTEEGAAHSITASILTDRPTRLFAPSCPARVILRSPDGPILQVIWGGRQQNIIACIGPERIGAEWWQSSLSPKPSAETSDRDYFTVQTDEGTWLWVGRCIDTGQWFVQGEWA